MTYNLSPEKIILNHEEAISVVQSGKKLHRIEFMVKLKIVTHHFIDVISLELLNLLVNIILNSLKILFEVKASIENMRIQISYILDVQKSVSRNVILLIIMKQSQKRSTEKKW